MGRFSRRAISSARFPGGVEGERYNDASQAMRQAMNLSPGHTNE